MAAPVDRKVQASTAAAYVSGLGVWLLGHYVFRHGVPDFVTSWVYAVVPAVLTFAAGYITRHSPRDVQALLPPAKPGPPPPAPGEIPVPPGPAPV